MAEPENPAIMARRFAERIVPQEFRADDWDERWREAAAYCDEPIDREAFAALIRMPFDVSPVDKASFSARVARQEK